jgi:hypothetical protein
VSSLGSTRLHGIAGAGYRTVETVAQEKQTVKLPSTLAGVIGSTTGIVRTEIVVNTNHLPLAERDQIDASTRQGTAVISSTRIYSGYNAQPAVVAPRSVLISTTTTVSTLAQLTQAVSLALD